MRSLKHVLIMKDLKEKVTNGTLSELTIETLEEMAKYNFKVTLGKNKDITGIIYNL